MKSKLFFLFFNFLVYFFLCSSYSSIYLSEANLVGQSVEILVENGSNATLEITRPDGSTFSKQLDQSGQTRIFLDQPGLWKFSYLSESKTLYIKDTKQSTKEEQNLTEQFFVVGFFLLLLISAILVYLLFNLYKNMNIKEPSLSKTSANQQLTITFQASKDLLENVVLKIKLENDEIVLRKEKLQPFQKLSYSCPSSAFKTATVNYQIGEQKYHISLDEPSCLSHSPEEQKIEKTPLKENQKQKRKLQKLD
ncbi:MAG: hypothetical protein N3D10_00770 [Candidatus Micrarchaeota archaeon]|nr:hypothetical protein [Candidatus Micrarchaeota archaeon]